MSAPIAGHTAVDVLQVHAIFTVLSRLQLLAPDLVVVRGSTAVYTHAPTSSRVPNDLDIFWLGDSSAVPDLISAIIVQRGVQASGARLVSARTRVVTLPDPRISALHRVDLLVWLDSAQQPSHRLWLDISTSRRIIPARRMRIRISPQVATEVSVVPVHDALAEKLWVYVESAVRDRADMRWSDLFDMISLISGALELQRYSPNVLRTTCARYFISRGSLLPRWLPEPPREWRPAWYRQVGEVAQRAPSLEQAWSAVSTFWLPVLRARPGCDGLRWNSSRWGWE